MMIKTAMVGRDAVMNTASALDGKASLNKGIVQVAGSAGTIEVNRLRQLAIKLEPLRSLLIRHERVEVPRGSSLPAKLMEFGYVVRHPGTGHDKHTHECPACENVMIEVVRYR